MAAGVRTRLRGAGTASNHRAGRSCDFRRRQRLLRDAPARRLQRESPTRTQFPPASARVAPSTSGPGLTWMNEKSLNFEKKGQMLKIQRSSNGEVIFRLAGQLNEEHDAEMERLLSSEP